MKKSKKELDAIIDNAAQAIRSEQADPLEIDAAAARVWARVGQHAAQSASAMNSNMETIGLMNNNAQQISGCQDFQSLIPDYLEGKLTPARTLLLEDHSHECIPCRREIKTQRERMSARPAAAAAASKGFGDRLRGLTAGMRLNNAARWGVAAVLVLGLGLASLFLYERLDLSGRTLAATVENADGMLFVVSDAQNSRPLGVGEQLQKGEHVRTGKDSAAVLRLADGSTIEMRERSEFSVSENTRGVTIRLDRGDVIVEAAKQDKGRLYVQTPDSLISVKGTIFAVESGTKGSRVSVVEGEVKVNHGGKDETLLPGDQTTTSPGLEKTSVEKNVAWSRNAARYASVVTELARLRRDVDQKVARPGVRYSSRFVDLVPENTVFYASLPNLAESLAESQRIMQERIRQNPALAEWRKANGGDGFGIDEKTMARIRELGSHLGDEIVISAGLDAKSEPSEILVLGEVKDGPAFRTYLDGQAANFAKGPGDMPNLRVIDDPMTAVASTSATGEKNKRSELFVWTNNNIFAASPQIESLRTLANTLKAPEANRFASSPFHQRLVDVYAGGAGLVVAADLERIVSQAIARDTSPDAGRHVEGLRQLGVTNLRDFIAEQKQVQGRNLSQASLTFSEPGKGIASWLAAPGPMGTLDFISPNANVVAAFVVKDPALLADDLLGFMETVDPEMRRHMQEVEKQQGFDIRNDLAAPLGGEFAFAIDGPLLPTPSWKMVLEVYDQAKLQNTFERAVEKLNQFSMLHGKGKLAIETSESGGRTFYAIRSDVGLEVNYTYANGYLVAAPSRALLEQSLRNREAGNTLVRSARFISSLPQDGNTNFSAILYHDLAPLMQTLAEKMKSAGSAIPEQEREKLNSFDASAPPTLVYAYSQGANITFAANTEGGAFGLSPASLIGMPNSFEMQHVLMNALGKKDVQKKE